MIPADCGAGSPHLGPADPQVGPDSAPLIVLHLAHLRSGLGTSLSLSTRRLDLSVAALRPPPDTLLVRRRCAVGGCLGGERVSLAPPAGIWTLSEALVQPGRRVSHSVASGNHRKSAAGALASGWSSRLGMQARRWTRAGRGMGQQGNMLTAGAGGAGGGRQPPHFPGGVCSWDVSPLVPRATNTVASGGFGGRMIGLGGAVNAEVADPATATLRSFQACRSVLGHHGSTTGTAWGSAWEPGAMCSSTTMTSTTASFLVTATG